MSALSLLQQYNLGHGNPSREHLQAALCKIYIYILLLMSMSCRKMVVPLPAPLGLICMGGFYPVFASFCFVFLANGVNLSDGLDGLAGGTAAVAFVGMSIAVLPICSG